MEWVLSFLRCYYLLTKINRESNISEGLGKIVFKLYHQCWHRPTPRNAPPPHTHSACAGICEWFGGFCKRIRKHTHQPKWHWIIIHYRRPLQKTVGGGFKTYITHDRILGISVNILTKAFWPPMCFLFVYIQWKLFPYVWSYGLGWVEISTGEDGRGWPTSATGHPRFLVQNECNSSPFVHQWNFIMWYRFQISLRETRPLEGHFVRIIQYCGFQNYVRVFLQGGVSLNMYNIFTILGEK